MLAAFGACKFALHTSLHCGLYTLRENYAHAFFFLACVSDFVCTASEYVKMHGQIFTASPHCVQSMNQRAVCISACLKDLHPHKFFSKTFVPMMQLPCVVPKLPCEKNLHSCRIVMHWETPAPKIFGVMQ